MAEAFLVLRVTGACSQSSAWASWAASGGEDKEDDLDIDCKREGTFWAHVGYVHFSPYRVAFPWMDQRPDPGATPFVWLKTTNAYGTDLHLATGLSLESNWAVQVYELVDTLQPIGTFDPTVVLVRALGKEETVWPTTRKGNRSGRAPGVEPDEEDAGDHDEAHSDRSSTSCSDADAEAEAESDSEVADECDVDAAPEEDLGDFAFIVALAEEARMAGEDERKAEDASSDASSGSAHSDDYRSVCADDPEQLARSSSEDLDSEMAVSSSVDSLGDVPVYWDSPDSGPDAEGEVGADLADTAHGVAAAVRCDALESVSFPEGSRIAYYRNCKFVAYCCNTALHRNFCRLTRTAPGKRSFGGRPLGELIAFLNASFDADLPTAASHNKKVFDRADQLVARHELELNEAARSLFQYERPLNPGEHD